MVKQKIIMSLGRLSLIIIGAFITAYGLEAILIPNNMSNGGVTGISSVGSTSFGLGVIDRSHKFTIHMVRL